jgi:hypothetical protein
MIETCFKYDLHIINNQLSEPTYRNTNLNSKGWPDLTIANLKNIYLKNWKIEDIFNNSDHEYITFSLNFNSPIEKILITRFKTKYGNHNKFKKNFKFFIPKINKRKNKLRNKLPKHKHFKSSNRMSNQRYNISM